MGNPLLSVDGRSVPPPAHRRPRVDLDDGVNFGDSMSDLLDVGHVRRAGTVASRPAAQRSRPRSRPRAGSSGSDSSLPPLDPISPPAARNNRSQPRALPHTHPRRPRRDSTGSDDGPPSLVPIGARRGNLPPRSAPALTSNSDSDSDSSLPSFFAIPGTPPRARPPLPFASRIVTLPSDGDGPPPLVDASTARPISAAALASAGGGGSLLGAAARSLTGGWLYGRGPPAMGGVNDEGDEGDDVFEGLPELVDGRE